MYPLGWAGKWKAFSFGVKKLIRFLYLDIFLSIDTLLVTFRRLRGSPTSHRRVKLGVNCSLRRCRASSQSPFRSKPPDGNFSLHSLAPPFQTEPASLGFGLGYCAGTMRAGALKPGSQPTKAVSAEGPNANLPPQGAAGGAWLSGDSGRTKQGLVPSIGPQQRLPAGRAPSFGAIGTGFPA